MFRRTFGAAMAVILLVTGSGAPAAAEEGLAGLPAYEQVRELLGEGRYADAEPLSRELLAEAEARYGDGSAEAAKAIDLLVNVLYSQGKYRDEEPFRLARRSLAIKEKILGPEDPGVAKSLNILATLLLAVQDYAGAEPLYWRTLAIQEAGLGAKSPEVALTVNNLAMLHRNTGEYAEAEGLYRRALGIREEVYGPQHAQVAWTLNGLAILLEEMGSYAAARSAYERSLQIRETELGAEHIRVADSLNNLAFLEMLEGRYIESRGLYERALKIHKEQLGDEDVTVARTLGNLSHLLFLMGDFTRAEQLEREALRIRRKTQGDRHTGVATSLHRMADILQNEGRLDEAKRCLEEALSIWREFDAGHPEYARHLVGLADVDQAAGEYGEARALYEQGLEIEERALGPDHPEVASTLASLGSLLLATGSLEEARSLYERALAIREKAFGPDHPLVAEVLRQRGVLLARTGRTAEAMAAALRAEQIGREHLMLTIGALGERQALQYRSVRSSGLDLTLACAARLDEPRATLRAWNALARSRALVLDEMASRLRALHGFEDPSLRLPMEQWSQASRRLANLVVRGPGDLAPERYRSLLNAAAEAKESAERTLAESALFRERTMAAVEVNEIAADLPEGSSLVAFAVYRDEIAASPRPGSGPGAPVVAGRGQSRLGGNARYLAFVLRAGDAAPTLVPIGDARSVDDLVVRWRAEATGGARGGRSEEEKEAAYRALGLALRRMVWDPVVPELGEAGLTFVVPEGSLHLVNFATFPDDRGGFLLESGPILHHLSAEREALRPSSPGAARGGLLAVGGPDFDQAAPSAGAAGPSPPRSAAASPFRGAHSGCDSFRSTVFPVLPGAAQEAEEIVALWEKANAGPVVHLAGESASESAFKSAAPGNRILHLATHGFFLGSDCPSYLGESRGIGKLTPAPGREPAPPEAESPLLLSGLVLAGANRRSEAGPQEEDGILTAEEIAALPLDGVEWAVLSACDTGVGEVEVGEGVLGLRRSFRLAGTRTVIMSLWPVGDEPTRAWMVDLYRSRIGRGLNTPEALREASLAQVHRLRAAGKFAHPFYWGAFVAAGDWH